MSNRGVTIERGTTVTILCEFWQEDGVWNGVAIHLSVAAFGKTFESAKKNLLNSIISHLEAASEVGKLGQIFSKLKAVERESLNIGDIPCDSSMVKMLVARSGNRKDVTVCA